MTTSQLNRVVKLVRRTGDTVVVLENESDNVMVIMDFASYEDLLNNPQPVEELSEEELMEKINRDLAVWRAYNEKKKSNDFDLLAEAPARAPKVNGRQNLDYKRMESEDERLTQFAQPGQDINLYDAEKDEGVQMADRNRLAAIGQEESLRDVLSDEEEEKFYLEPIE